MNKSPTEIRVEVCKMFESLKISDEEKIDEIVDMLIECEPADNRVILHPADDMLAQVMDNSQFFGPTDWQRHYRVKFSDEIALPLELAKLKDILEEDCPFTAKKKKRETHFMFYLPKKFQGKNLHIRHWQEIHPKESQPRFYSYDNGWYQNKEFANKTEPTGQWYLMFKGVVLHLQPQSWNEKSKMLPNTHDLPLACEASPMHFFTHLKSGEYINKGIYGRTRDVDSDGARIILGNYGSDGLFFGSCWDKEPYMEIGAFAAQKFIV
jgi:hypothetical protein